WQTPWDDPWSWYDLALIDPLVPNATADPSLPVRLAERALAREPRNPEFLLNLGRALYRAGQPAAAVRRIQEANARDPHSRGAEDWFFLSMAYHSLGRAAEAQRWHDKAARWMDAALQPKREGAEPPPGWDRRLLLQLLRREVEAPLARVPGSVR